MSEGDPTDGEPSAPPRGSWFQRLRARKLSAVVAIGIALAAFAGGAVTTQAADPVSGRVIWRPASAGFYTVTVMDGEGRKAEARVRIKGGWPGPRGLPARPP